MMRLGRSLPRFLSLISLALITSAVHAQDLGSLLGPAEGHLTTNGSNPASLNTFLGATTFYNQPEHYTGTRATIAIIDAGHLWGGPTGHETLRHSTVKIDYGPNQQSTNILPINPAETGTELGEIDFHGTGVAHVAAGRTGPADGSGTSSNNNRHAGIAFGAELWSGAVATSWNNATSFNISANSLYYPYVTSLITGVNVSDGNGGFVLRKADVVNSSFGYDGDPGGASVPTVAFDGIAAQTGKTIVFSAGNSGPGTNTIGGPGNGYNTIVVGATAQGSGSYTGIASFSSRGPQRYVGPDGTVNGARARVDIVAPGSGITLASYRGGEGGNPFRGFNSTNPSPTVYENQAGTSFAAPMVAGGATLLCDVGYDKFDGGTSVHANVIKAVLLNSADKLPGWNNGQTNQNGVITTTQALDYTFGAGQMNLDKAYTQYTAGTTDVAGDAGGTNLSAIGWDLGAVDEDGFNDYFFSSALLGGSTFTATMNWFVGRQFGGVTFDGDIFATDEHFIDLDLELWQLNNGVPSSMIALSTADYINTEHFQIILPETAQYMLRVHWVGERYNIDEVTEQQYGIAWFGTAFGDGGMVPEPGTFRLLAVGGLALLVVCKGVVSRQ